MSISEKKRSQYTRHEFKEFGGDFSATSYQIPKLQKSEVLIKVNFCGVCHSDVHIHEGYYELGGGKKLSLLERGIKPPVTLGHEVVGTVVDVGNEEESNLIGKQFLVYPWIGCGECVDCFNDKENLCITPASIGIFKPGGYAENLIIPSSRYLIDIEGLDAAHASMLACSGLTTYSAINKIMPVSKEDSVVVVGCGGLGQLAIRILSSMGIENIKAVDISGDKRELAVLSGANETFDPADSEAIDKILFSSDNRCAAVLDFVGNDQTVALGLNVLKKGGEIVIVGLHGGELKYPIPVIITKAISIIGSYTGSLGELNELVTFAKQNYFFNIPVEMRNLAEAERSIYDLAQGNVKGRIILENN